MVERLRRRRVPPPILGAVLVVLAACTTEPSGGSPQPSAGSPSRPPTPTTSLAPSTTPSPTSGPRPTDPPAADAIVEAGSVRIRAPRGGSLLVRGDYPEVTSTCVRPERRRLLARYPGTLLVRRSDDGTLALTVTLPFERYLEGIAEVPASWPRAALEAQAIAARTYALATTGWNGSEGEELRTTICATSACQVYRGIPVPPSPDVGRWYRAVRATAGEALLYEGRPAETLYFSTSNGRTYGNDQVFGSAPLPYLRPVVERDDGASPTSRWRVRIPFGDLARFLDEAGEWPGRRTITAVRLDGTTVVVSGDGSSRSMDLGAFRDAVNTWAPCLEPRRYPPDPLPVTVPSRWLSLSSGPHAALVAGRGWGHGVGMVQWGAYGKAVRGVSASEILAFYYGGLRPEAFPEPGLIRVRVASGLTELRIAPSGPGATLDGRPLGAGRLSIAGGERLTVTSGGA